ncbi:TonB-dependent receptor [Colwelliaceae bacterium 6441]
MFKSNKIILGILSSALISGVTTAQAEEAGSVNKKEKEEIEVISVTARKTKEPLQEVPLAISVLSGAFIEQARLTDVNDLLARIPGIGFGQPFKSYTPIAIRGASTQDDSVGVDPNVSIFIDGVAVGSTSAIEFDLLDLERVEVLKGPQGTLFGKNTNGGVIHYVTRTPDEFFMAGSSLTMGNHERMEASGYISGELAKDVYGSFSLRTRNSGGYVKNLVTNNTLGQDKVSSGRAKLRFVPTEELDIVIAADYMLDDSYGTPRYYEGPRPSLIDADSPFDGGSFDKVAQDLDGNYDRESFGISATVKYETDIGTFHSITAHRDYEGNLYNFDFDAVNGRTENGRDSTEAFPWQQTVLETFSQEFRLDWTIGENFRATTGLYYSDEHQYRIEELAASGIPGSEAYNGWYETVATQPRAILDQEVDSVSMAIFTDIQFYVTEDLTLSVGGRWSKDEKDSSTTCHQVGPFWCNEVYTAKSNASWSEPSYRFVADYQITDEIMGYASYSRGYKSGGFSNSASGDGSAAEVAPLLAVPYLPEFSDSYEVGLRIQALDRRLTFNPTFFRVEYTDIQFLFNNGVSFISGNIGSGENQGIEADLSFKVTDAFSFWANYTYQDSEYTAGLSYDVPIKGNMLQLTPKNSLTAGFSYVMNFDDGSGLTFSADTVQKSRQFDDATNDILASTVFKDLYNANIEYQINESISVSAWVKNALDKRNAVGTNAGLDALVYSTEELNSGSTGLWRTYTAPRSYGVTLRWEFE